MAVLVPLDELSYPSPLFKAPPGDYQAMALIDEGRRYAYYEESDGDLRSPTVSLVKLDPANAGIIDLTITERAPQKENVVPPVGEAFDFVSPALTEFWGRPIHMKGVVVLPPNYTKSSRTRFPTVYWIHGAGADLSMIERWVAPDITKKMSARQLPSMIYVLLDQTCPSGTHEFADSANNGPWGKALVSELIPYLERKYRMRAVAKARFLTGHSSGGWAALWLQVSYSGIFGGAWPTAPDPADFRNFTGPNLCAKPLANFFHDANGRPWPLVRVDGREIMSLEEFARREMVLGDYGGQMASFEWVFSPRGQDGRPQRLFDRKTGMIDPDVAKAWEKYDISSVLRKNADRLRPLLQDKIHLFVGTEDSFHLDESVRLLDQTMKELRIRAVFTYLPGKTHLNLYDDGLDIKIGKEMEAAAGKQKRRRMLDP